MINFIVDFPVRVDHLVNVRYGSLLGRTVFVLVEFQVLDEATAKANDEGENAHELYKERQNKIVAARLRKGVFIGVVLNVAATVVQNVRLELGPVSDAVTPCGPNMASSMTT